MTLVPTTALRRSRPYVLAGCLLAGFGSLASEGRAQPAPAAPSDADRQLAQSLFDRGRELMAKGDFASACPLLAESQRLDPGGGTLVNLAVCNEQAGRLATAHAQFHEALSQAIREGRKDRQQIAEERIAAILPKLSRIAIEVPAAADVPGLVLKLDGVAVSRAAWGTPTAVDGGEHRVEASAPGRETWTSTVRIAPAQDTKRISVPPLGQERAMARPDAGPLPPPTTERSGPPTWIGVTALTTGGIALGVGFVTGFVALLQSTSLGIECDEQNRCPRTLQDNVDSYYAFGTVSTIGFIGGGVLVAAGVVLLVIGESKPPPSPMRTGRGLSVGPRGVGARF